MGEKRELKMKSVTDRAMAEVRFCSHFSFSRSPFPVSRFSIIQLPDGAQSFVYLCLLFPNCDEVKYCDVFISQ